jgi:hypothetical protein
VAASQVPRLFPEPASPAAPPVLPTAPAATWTIGKPKPGTKPQDTAGEKKKTRWSALCWLAVVVLLLGFVTSRAYVVGHSDSATRTSASGTGYSKSEDFGLIEQEKRREEKRKERRDEVFVIVSSALAVAQPGQTTPAEFQVLVNNGARILNSGLNEAELLPAATKVVNSNGMESLAVRYNPPGPHCVVIGFVKSRFTGDWVVVMGSVRSEDGTETTVLPGFGRFQESER